MWDLPTKVHPTVSSSTAHQNSHRRQAIQVQNTRYNDKCQQGNISKQRQKLYAFLVIKYSVLENINVFIDLLCLSQTQKQRMKVIVFTILMITFLQWWQLIVEPHQKVLREVHFLSQVHSLVFLVKNYFVGTLLLLLSNSLSILLSPARTINAFCPLSLLTFDCCRLHQGLLPALQPSVPL